MPKIDAEDELAMYLDAMDWCPPYERQYKYVPSRPRFKADFAFPSLRLLVEVQGGVYTRQAHGSITGIVKDIERGNLATLNGWRLIRVLPKMVSNGEALDLIEKVVREA